MTHNQPQHNGSNTPTAIPHKLRATIPMMAFDAMSCRRMSRKQAGRHSLYDVHTIGSLRMIRNWFPARGLIGGLIWLDEIPSVTVKKKELPGKFRGVPNSKLNQYVSTVPSGDQQVTGPRVCQRFAVPVVCLLGLTTLAEGRQTVIGRLPHRPSSPSSSSVSSPAPPSMVSTPPP